MSELSLFNKYHGKENTITNYCGLMLKILYQSNPTKFESCIQNLIDEEVNLIVEPKFLQQIGAGQKGKKTSIADLSIKQTEFELTFEVKTSDWFYENQFDKYIQNLNKSNIKNNKILFALTTEFIDESKFDELKIKAKKSNILLQLITFKKLLNTLQEFKPNDTYYNQFLDEFEQFLETENLLPSWQEMLDVVNCAQSIKEVEQFSYYCPNTGGAYNHIRSKYFAPYKNKEVTQIYEIDAVVEISFNGEPVAEKVKYNNCKKSEKDLKEKALRTIMQFPNRLEELKKYPIQIFLLSNKAETKFIKNSPRGLFGSKKYFRGIAKDKHNSQELAEYLKNKTWEEFN